MKKLMFILIFIIGCEQQTPVLRSGDIVTLKSGGAPMTVVRDVYNRDMVKVEWHDINGQPCHEYYYQSQLKQGH